MKKSVKTSSFTQLTLSEANKNYKTFTRSLNQLVKYMHNEGNEDVELLLSTVETNLTIEQITVKSLLPFLKLQDKEGNKRELFSYYEVLRAVKKLALN